MEEKCYCVFPLFAFTVGNDGKCRNAKKVFFIIIWFLLLNCVLFLLACLAEWECWKSPELLGLLTGETRTHPSDLHITHGHGRALSSNRSGQRSTGHALRIDTISGSEFFHAA